MKFSFHYVVYTILFVVVSFSVINIVTATTPNPGHPWLEIGDGAFQVTYNQTATRTYTFPDASTTVLTTNDLVTVAQGGIGIGTLASNGVLYGNGTGAVQALAVNAGATQCLTQASSAAPAWGTCGGVSDGDKGDIVVSASGATWSIDADVIDWADIADSMTVDAATDINLSTFALTIDMDSTGDFSIRDGVTDIASFTDSGAITFAPTSGQSLTNTLLGVGTFAIDSGVTTGTTTTSALTLSPSALTTGTGLYAVAGNSFTSGKLVDIQVSSTGSLTNQTALNILTTGINGTGAQTTYGAQIANTHSGTSTNVGLYATATGGTNNYAGIFAAGSVGIGTAAPGSLLTLETAGAADNVFNINTTNASTTSQVRMSLTRVGDTGSGLSRGMVLFAYATSGNSGNSGWADYEARPLSFFTGTVAGSATQRATILNDGKFGIGDATPASLLTVGNGDLFQVSSTGAIAASVGITSTQSITDSGQLVDLNLTLVNDANADTISALNIDVTSVATGADGDALYGVNVANLTSADADVAESALFVGTGWDKILDTGALDITQAGAITGATGITSSGTITFGSMITDANAVLYTTTAGVVTRVVETETGSQCLLSGAGASGVPVWGACGGSGTVTATGGSLTSNAVVLGAGGVDTKVVAGITTNGTAQLVLGVNTTTLGTLKMFGNTSGDVTLQPTAVAGTATVQTLPATTGTLVNRVTTGAGVSASNTDGALSFTLGAITPTTTNGLTITANGTNTLNITAGKTLAVTNSLTLSGTDSTVMTFPTTSATIARTDAGQTFTGVNTFTSPRIITDISDTNGNELFKFTATASAVNELTLTNAATGGIITLAATGGDTDVEFSIDSKGADALNLNNNATGNILLGGGSSGTGCTVTNSSGAFACTAGLSGTQLTSTISTGTAPFVVSSTTNVANLNASSLSGATFAAPGSIGSGTPGSGAFTTLTSNGATTLGTGASLTNTFGSGASSINTIGSATTPGTLTLRGSTIVAGDANTTAFTFGNVTTNPTFSLLGTGLTTLGGNLTVTGTAWTATPTISGLITATSGITSNGTLTANGTVALGDGGDAVTINSNALLLQTTGAGSDITLNAVDQIILTDFTTCTSLETVANVLTCGSDAGGNTAWSDIGVPTANLTLAMDADITTFNYDTLTTGTGFNLASTSLTSGGLLDLTITTNTAGITGQKALNVYLGGTLTGAQTTYGTYISNAHGGAGNTNVALFAEAVSGATNYSIIVPLGGGNVGIGTSAPASALTVVGDFSLTNGNVNIGGNADFLTEDDRYASFDDNNSRFGFTKKASNIPKLTYGSGINFTIASSSATDIQASNTFTDTFTLTPAGNADILGTITSGSANTVLTLSTGKVDADALTLAPLTGTATTNSSSGLEVVTDGLSLLKGCADGQILEYTNDATGWSCGNDDSGGGGALGTSGGLITKTTAADRLSLIYGDAGDVQLDITNIANSVVPTADAMQILLSGGAGITTDDVDGLYINIEGANGTSTDVSGLHIDFDPIAGSSDDTFTGLLIDGVTGTAATENGLTIGAGWDSDITFADLTPTMSIADNGTLVLSDGSSTTNTILSVGTATSRGNALVYGNIVSDGYDISRSITGVIDVFIYDTAGDVDNGEWTKSDNSLLLSWATETKDDGAGDACVIASDDRCGSSAFPKKSILATTADGLYIFDAADNSLWMKFTQSGGTYALGADTNNNPSGVGAQNGIIVVGTNGSSATGMYAFDFKRDILYNYDATDRTSSNITLGTRNTAATYATGADTQFAIVNAIVNDVSIAQQSRSTEGLGSTYTLPLDSGTGPLKVGTIIAAATDSGVSVINLGQSNVFNYSDNTNDDYNQVVMTSRGRLFATNEATGQLEEWRNVDKVLATQANGTPFKVYDELLAGGTPITLGTAPTISTSPTSLAVVERASQAREPAAAGTMEPGDIVYIGTNQGLAEVHTSGGALAGGTWSKVTTKDVGTPYMVGSVRAMYLFDEAVGATAAQSAIGAAGTTNNPMDSANGTAPTFGGDGVRGTSINFGNNSYLCSDANADGTCDADADFNAGTVGFTVSLWFKHGTSAAADTLFERCYTPATPTVAVGCAWAGMTASGTIAFGIDSITTWTYETTYDDRVISTEIYNDNEWHHAVFTNTDSDICLYIDGKQAAACDTSLAATATLDASQVLTIGGVCSGAACVTGTNFWDGSIDEFMWSSNGATTASGMEYRGVSRLFQDGRSALTRPTTDKDNATTATSTTIGDSTAVYTQNSLAGQIVELYGGTGAGQVRTIISNDTTTLTVSPAFSPTPDTTTDYRVAPHKLYGASNTVTSIAVDGTPGLGKTRRVYVGTNDAGDGGGVSIFDNASTNGQKMSVISSESSHVASDNGVAWSGTDADDIRALAFTSGTLAIANEVTMRVKNEDISLTDLKNSTEFLFDDLRQQIASMGNIFGAGLDIISGGADLAEYYYSNTPLEAGDVVAIQPDQPAGIGKSGSRYQKNLLGVVSTRPGLTLGPVAENAYPIALGGRIPVKITNENGAIRVGDLLTSASKPGYAMRATTAGAVLGRVINEPYSMTSCDAPLPDIETAVGDGPGVVVEVPTEGDVQLEEEVLVTPTPEPVPTVVDPNAPQCGYAMLFVGLGESLGKNVETLTKEFMLAQGGQATVEGLTTVDTIEGAEALPIQQSIMMFLRSVKANLESTHGMVPESIFTDRISAGLEVLTPTLIADTVLTNIISPQTGSKEIGVVIGSDGKFTIGTQTITLGDDGTSITTVNTIVTFDGATNSAVFAGQAKFEGLSFFTNTTSFAGGVTFAGQAEFVVPPLYNKDSAGYALIKQGDKRAQIVFAEPYMATPVVNTSVTFEEDDLEDEETSTFFADDIRFIVMGKNQDGFIILLNKPATRDIRFSWNALAVRDPSIFESIFEGLIIEPTPTPTPDPDPEVTPEPEPTLEGQYIPDPDVTPTPDPVVEPEPEAIPETEPTPEGESTPEPESTPTPETTPQDL